MGNWLIILLIAAPAAIGQTYFVYRYVRYSSWAGDIVGRALLIKSAALGLLVDVALISELIWYFFPDSAWAYSIELFEIWVYLLASAAIWWQLIVLLKVQRAELRRRKDKDDG